MYAVMFYVIGERERSLPSRPNGAIFLYIIYPALMYAVMFYVILNKRKLHFPLAKNVMHSPSRYYGMIYPALMYAVMFYVILNKRKRLGDCVTFFLSGRRKYEKNACAFSMLHAVKARLAITRSVNAFMQAASSLRPLRGVVWGPCFMRLSSVRSRSPKMHC